MSGQLVVYKCLASCVYSALWQPGYMTAWLSLGYRLSTYRSNRSIDPSVPLCSARTPCFASVILANSLKCILRSRLRSPPFLFVAMTSLRWPGYRILQQNPECYCITRDCTQTPSHAVLFPLSLSIFSFTIERIVLILWWRFYLAPSVLSCVVVFFCVVQTV